MIDECVEVNNFDWLLGVGLALGDIPLSFLPQWVKLRRQESHLGVSLANNLCMALAAWMGFVGYFCSEYSQTFSCCLMGHGAYQCVGSLAPVLQTFCDWLGPVVVVGIYFWTFDRSGLAKLDRDAPAELKSAKLQAAAMVLATVAIAAVPAGLAVAARNIESPDVGKYGVYINLAMVILTGFHWIFQAYETWSLGEIGSLSVFATVVSAGGAVLAGFSFLAHDSPSVALSYFVASVMMTAVLIIGFHGEWKRKKAERLEDPNEESGDTRLTGGGSSLRIEGSGLSPNC